VDPALGQFRPPTPSRFGRFAQVQLFRAEAPDELVATRPASLPESRLGGVLVGIKRMVFGPPLPTSAVSQERMVKPVALAVLGSDLLSSVAYGPEAMLAVLVLGGSAALGLSLPIAAALLVLMIALGASYRQTIRAYPSGAGSYVVASDNLGRYAGLVAAAGLLSDYVLTVAVSVASGVDALTSAMPRFAPHGAVIGLGVILALLAGNLRGIRQAGAIFAAPTYAFLVGIFALILVGFVQAGQRGFQPITAPPIHATEALTLFLVLRAFASGATSMTGIEAVSNALPAFRPPEWRSGLTTLTWMVSLMVAILAGLVTLIHLDGIVPRPGETVLSQLGHEVFGAGMLYAYLQAATMLVLFLAANTAFNDFPRLLSVMAHDDYAPRLFLRVGDRLALTNGMVTLTVLASILFLTFRGRTEALIPLYAVGVFLAFTLSQTGMVAHWWRAHGSHWRKSVVVNGAGAALTAVVTVIVAVTKFSDGSWVTLVAIPLTVGVLVRIHSHYDIVNTALSVREPSQNLSVAPFPSDEEEHEETPEQVHHLIVVPVSRLHLASLRALAYAASFATPTFAVHIAPSEEGAEQFREQWTQWGNHIRLETIVSPYRAVVPPLTHYLEALHYQRPDLTITVVLYELVPAHHWEQLLHSPVASRLRKALRPLPDLVITSVPFHLSRTSTRRAHSGLGPAG
jgi:amino acid transporter